MEKLSPIGEASVLYIDYGNRANIPKAHCATLPGSFVSLPPFAHEYLMALCLLCTEVSNRNFIESSQKIST